MLLSANNQAVIYLVSAILFILSLKGLTHPSTARRGNFLGMAGMALAVVATLLGGQIESYGFIVAGVLVGAVIGVVVVGSIFLFGNPSKKKAPKASPRRAKTRGDGSATRREPTLDSAQPGAADDLFADVEPHQRPPGGAVVRAAGEDRVTGPGAVLREVFRHGVVLDVLGLAGRDQLVEDAGEVFVHGGTRAVRVAPGEGVVDHLVFLNPGRAVLLADGLVSMEHLGRVGDFEGNILGVELLDLELATLGAALRIGLLRNLFVCHLVYHSSGLGHRISPAAKSEIISFFGGYGELIATPCRHAALEDRYLGSPDFLQAGGGRKRRVAAAAHDQHAAILQLEQLGIRVGQPRWLEIARVDDMTAIEIRHRRNIDDDRVPLVHPGHGLRRSQFEEPLGTPLQLGYDQHHQNSDEAADQQWMVGRELDDLFHVQISFMK